MILLYHSMIYNKKKDLPAGQIFYSKYIFDTILIIFYNKITHSTTGGENGNTFNFRKTRKLRLPKSPCQFQASGMSQRISIQNKHDEGNRRKSLRRR